jgi:hypothetical protein
VAFRGATYHSRAVPDKGKGTSTAASKINEVQQAERRKRKEESRGTAEKFLG